MPIEETMWDVLVYRESKDHQQLRSELARAVAERLPVHKELLRVVQWSPNAGCLFAPPRAGVRRYAVAYTVRST